jgi:flavin reductase (DIM6/NTAB) family NADH-FMN oxidoreductase RutF
LKDTDRNIRETGEFVVNFVSKEFLEKMHLSGKDYPPNESEAEILNVPTEPSKIVLPPKVKGVPAALECKLKEIVEIGDTPMSLIFGEVVAIHFEEKLLETSKGIVGRLGGKRYTIIDNEIDLSNL